MKVMDWIREWESRVPLALQEAWDHSGIQVGRTSNPLRGVVLTLDLTEEAIEVAKSNGCNLILTHHPVLFSETHRLEESNVLHELVFQCLESGIAVYASHTPFDFVNGGVNDALAAKAGIAKESLEALRPRDTNSPLYAFSRGMGTMGRLLVAISLSDFAAAMSDACLQQGALYYGDPRREIQKVGFLGGSGMDFAEDAYEAGCDAFVTGDVKYHEAREWVLRGLSIVDLGHYPSEFPALVPMMTISREIAPDVEHFLLMNGEESIRHIAQ